MRPPGRTMGLFQDDTNVVFKGIGRVQQRLVEEEGESSSSNFELTALMLPASPVDPKPQICDAAAGQLVSWEFCKPEQFQNGVFC